MQPAPFTIPTPSVDLWWVYLIQRDDGRFYVGMSSDVANRVMRHHRGTAANFTRGSQKLRLVGAVPIGSRRQASRFERKVKRWQVDRKFGFFAMFSPVWERFERTGMVLGGEPEALRTAMLRHDTAEQAMLAARHEVMSLLITDTPELADLIRQLGMDTFEVIRWFFCFTPLLLSSPATAMTDGRAADVMSWLFRSTINISTRNRQAGSVRHKGMPPGPDSF